MAYSSSFRVAAGRRAGALSGHRDLSARHVSISDLAERFEVDIGLSVPVPAVGGQVVLGQKPIQGRPGDAQVDNRVPNRDEVHFRLRLARPISKCYRTTVGSTVG